MKPRIVLASLALAILLGCASSDSISPASTKLWQVSIRQGNSEWVRGVHWIRQDANTVAFMDSSRAVIAEYRIGAIVSFTAYPSSFIPESDPTAPGLDDILGR